jgi:hypothetical protein
MCIYFDKHYHVAGSWLGRFAWFRRKQQLHFLHHWYADCNFAVVDNFWDWLLGTYRSIGVDHPLVPLGHLPRKRKGSPDIGMSGEGDFADGCEDTHPGE